MPSLRRQFLQNSAALAAVGIAQSAACGRATPNEIVRIGVIGAGGRALSLIDSFSRNKAVRIVAIADIDQNRLPTALDTAEKNQGTKPRAENDFRRLIDDKSIDAIAIGTPDHWHAIPTILACQAGKMFTSSNPTRMISLKG